MKRPLALIAAPEARLRAILARLARGIGCGPELADTPRRATEILERHNIDLAIIAPGQFGTEGRALLRRLNSTRLDLAVLFGQQDNRDGWAKLAPHAYLAAYDPLDEQAFLDWLITFDAKSNLPRPFAPEPELWELEGIALDRAARLLRYPAGDEVALSRAEFGALMAFIASPGRVLSRDHLRRAVFGEQSEAYDRSVDMLVSRLRRKIEADPKNPRRIVTIPGAGYRMTVLPRKVTAVAATTVPAVTLTRPPGADAERRPLTILIGGLGDMAALSQQLDPDDLAMAVIQLADLCRSTVERWGGQLVSFYGHGLVAYFGYPMAHEDDPERAIEAGDEIIETIARTKISDNGFRARAGIATGSVVIGHFGPAAAGTAMPSAVGEATSIAAQLEAAAEPGAILVDNNTRRRAGRVFAYQAFATLRVQGMKRPIETWRLLGKARYVGRFAARTIGEKRFVGRHEELALLEHRWDLACAGAGQVVVMLGEPGIGKSRLAAEFSRSLRPATHAQLKCFASPHHTATPLFPISRQIERAAGFVAGDDALQKLEKLEGFLASLQLASEEALALLAHLLSIANPTEERLLRIGVPQRGRMTIALLQQLAARFGAGLPVVMVWEDAQWFDGLTLELLASEVERAMRENILILVTARPGFEPPWADHPHIRQLTLPRLDRAAAEELLDYLMGDDALSQAQRGDILERADGIPLFLEELTKEELGRPRLTSDTSETWKIPGTLHGLLLARIDRSGSAGKTVAQIGSAIGRSFSYELLRLIERELEVDTALSQLIRSEILFCRGEPPHATYVFRHVLVQNAAYASLAGGKRRDVHGRIAETLERHFSDVARSQPELLAHHHRQAGHALSAIDYWLVGAEGALLRSASAESQKQLEEAFKLLRTLPDDENRRRRELTGQLIQHRIAVVANGRTSEPASRALRRALRLCEELQDDLRLPPIIYGQWYTAWSSARFREARRHAGTLLEWAHRHASPEVETHAEFALGLCSQNDGLLEEAVRHLQRARELDQFETLPGAPAAGYWAAGVVRAAAELQLQFCFSLLGRIADAEGLARGAPPAGGLASQPFAEAIAQLCTARLHALLREPQRVIDATTGLSDASYPDFSSHGMVYRGWALSMIGETTEGLRLARDGTERATSVGYRTWHSHMTILSAECEWRAGDPARALSILDSGKAEITKSGERFLLADLYRMQAELRLATGRIDIAKGLLRKAIGIAQQQNARLLELRAATALARLWAKAGRKAKACALLTPIIAGFETNADFADLRAARAVMNFPP